MPELRPSAAGGCPAVPPASPPPHRGRPPRGRTLPASLPLALLGLLLAASAQAGDYRLGPQDKVRLIVFEWRSSRAETYPWTPLNAEFTISAAGELSLPLIGPLKADALTPAQLGSAVAEQLQRKLGLVERPTAAAEVSHYRPFYITGDVANPGEFPFRPDLTALKAFALAGGAYRPLGATAAGLAREAITARGDLRVIRAEQTALLAKWARLRAEAADQAQIDFPAELAGKGAAPEAGDARREEELIFQSRRSAVRSKVENLTQGKLLLDREIATLAAKDASLEKQLTLALSERDNVRMLASKGLAIATRQLATEQTVAQMETARLDIGIARVRAEQDRARLDRGILELQDQRRAEILQELRQTEMRLNELRERLTTSDRLIFHAEVSGLRRAEDDRREEAGRPAFTILRAGTANEIEADPNTGVEPGDVVQVRWRQPTSGGAAPVAAHLPPRPGDPAAPSTGRAAAVAARVP